MGFKILQVIDTLNVGGGERVFVTICNILKENKEDVTAFFLLTPGHLSAELGNEIPQLVLNRDNKFGIKKMAECASVIRKFDVVHCHFRHVYRYVKLVAKLFFVKSTIVLHDHYGSIDIDQAAPGFFQAFLKPSHYIGVSKSLCNWAVSQLKLAPSRIFLLENIIIPISQKERKAGLKSFDWILVSNIKPIKNNIFAVELAKKAQKSILLLGQNQDGKYYDLVMNQVGGGNIEIDSSVNNAQEVMHLAKLGLHTSKSETGPLVLIEYLAQGIPFLAYETGEVSKILKPYFPDFFIDSFEFDLWLERIEKIQNSPIDKEKMQQVFEKYFGKHAYYEKLRTIYQCIKGS